MSSTCLQVVQIFCVSATLCLIVFALFTRRYIFLGAVPILVIAYAFGGGRFAQTIDAQRQTAAESPAAKFAVYAVVKCQRPPPFKSVPWDLCVAEVVQDAQEEYGPAYANQAAQALDRFAQRANKEVPLSVF